MNEPVAIERRDYWFKVIEMLQQNWALIEPGNPGVTVYFVTDTSGVFDEMEFASAADADAALRRNGFGRFSKTLVPPRSCGAVSRPSAALRIPTARSIRQDGSGDRHDELSPLVGR